jgi:hypothetical protein
MTKHTPGPEMTNALTQAERYLSTLALALREGAVTGLDNTWPTNLTRLVDDIRTLLAKIDG